MGRVQLAVTFSVQKQCLGLKKEVPRAVSCFRACRRHVRLSDGQMLWRGTKRSEQSQAQDKRVIVCGKFSVQRSYLGPWNLVVLTSLMPIALQHPPVQGADGINRWSDIGRIRGTQRTSWCQPSVVAKSAGVDVRRPKLEQWVPTLTY